MLTGVRLRIEYSAEHVYITAQTSSIVVIYHDCRCSKRKKYICLDVLAFMKRTIHACVAGTMYDLQANPAVHVFSVQS